MDAYVITLRILHITGGAFWFGAAAAFALFIEPTATALGAQGGGFMAHLSTKKRLPVVIAIASAISILTGVLLYWRDSSGLDADWIASGPGLGFTIGGLAAIASWLIGFLISRPSIDRMAALTEALAAGDDTAGAEMERLGHRLQAAGRGGLVLLAVAVVAMATARYL